MNHTWSPWPILLCLVVAVAGCERRPELSDEDRQAREDDKGAEKAGPQQESEIFPDTPAGRQLREHMMVLALPTESPEDADRRYAASLAKLRTYSRQTVELLNSAYRRIDTARYYDRWALVKTLADLEVPSTYQGLSGIARAPLPPELNKDTHHFSTQEEEVMIRLRAVDGLGRLAAKGHKASEADLLALATATGNPNLAIQARAIKAYLRAGRDYQARVRLLKSRLPQDRHGIVTLDVMPQNEFEQKVRGLAVVSDSNTTRDAAEERLRATQAPTVAPTQRKRP